MRVELACPYTETEHKISGSPAAGYSREEWKVATCTLGIDLTEERDTVAVCPHCGQRLLLSVHLPRKQTRREVSETLGEYVSFFLLGGFVGLVLYSSGAHRWAIFAWILSSLLIYPAVRDSTALTPTELTITTQEDGRPHYFPAAVGTPSRGRSLSWAKLPQDEHQQGAGT